MQTSTNAEQTQSFLDSLNGQTFICHYNPSNTADVIRERIEMSAVIHSTIWPTLLMIGGLVLVILTHIQSITCWRDDAKPEDDDDDDDMKQITKMGNDDVQSIRSGVMDKAYMDGDNAAFQDEYAHELDGTVDNASEAAAMSSQMDGSRLSVAPTNSKPATATTTISHA